MIERTIRDLNFADYRLVKYEDDRFFIEYKDKTEYRIVINELHYKLEKLTKGITLVKEADFEKVLTGEELLNWVLDVLKVKPEYKDIDWLDDENCILLKEFLLQKTKNGFKLSYRNPDEDIQYSIESSSMPSLIKAIESTMKEE